MRERGWLGKGPFKYYISALGGGGLTQIADVADALRGGWGVLDWNADVILEYVHSKMVIPKSSTNDQYML